jgi:hypothetical protein
VVSEKPGSPGVRRCCVAAGSRAFTNRRGTRRLARRTSKRRAAAVKS